jgi:hypothetical protein
LKLRGVSEDIERITEYKKSVLTYYAARTYELSDLNIFAKTNIGIFNEAISIFDFLNIVREVFPKFLKDKI